MLPGVAPQSASATTRQRLPLPPQLLLLWLSLLHRHSTRTISVKRPTGLPPALLADSKIVATRSGVFLVSSSIMLLVAPLPSASVTILLRPSLLQLQLLRQLCQPFTSSSMNLSTPRKALLLKRVSTKQPQHQSRSEAACRHLEEHQHCPLEMTPWWQRRLRSAHREEHLLFPLGTTRRDSPRALWPLCRRWHQSCVQQLRNTTVQSHPLLWQIKQQRLPLCALLRLLEEVPLCHSGMTARVLQSAMWHRHQNCLRWLGRQPCSSTNPSRLLTTVTSKKLSLNGRAPQGPGCLVPRAITPLGMCLPSSCMPLLVEHHPSPSANSVQKQASQESHSWLLHT